MLEEARGTAFDSYFFFCTRFFDAVFGADFDAVLLAALLCLLLALARDAFVDRVCVEGARRTGSVTLSTRRA